MIISNRALVFIAFALGLLAMVVRNPKFASHTDADIKEIAKMIEREEDHVTPDELAKMLMQGGHHLRIVDIRDSSLFALYHLPTAERFDISKLTEISFPSSDSVVIYSDGGIHAAQAWMLLSLQGQRNVFTLHGGLNEWRDRILSPVLSPELSRADRDRILLRAQFFGGGQKSDKSRKSATPKRPTVAEPNRLKEREKPREIC